MECIVSENTPVRYIIHNNAVGFQLRTPNTVQLASQTFPSHLSRTSAYMNLLEKLRAKLEGGGCVRFEKFNTVVYKNINIARYYTHHYICAPHRVL